MPATYTFIGIYFLIPPLSFVAAVVCIMPTELEEVPQIHVSEAKDKKTVRILLCFFHNTTYLDWNGLFLIASIPFIGQMH